MTAQWPSPLPQPFLLAGHPWITLGPHGQDGACSRRPGISGVKVSLRCSHARVQDWNSSLTVSCCVKRDSQFSGSSVQPPSCRIQVSALKDAAQLEQRAALAAHSARIAAFATGVHKIDRSIPASFTQSPKGYPTPHHILREHRWPCLCLSEAKSFLKSLCMRIRNRLGRECCTRMRRFNSKPFSCQAPVLCHADVQK